MEGSDETVSISRRQLGLYRIALSALIATWVSLAVNAAIYLENF